MEKITIDLVAKTDKAVAEVEELKKKYKNLINKLKGVIKTQKMV